MAGSITLTALFFAIAGGILPALLWLWFWLKEDKKRPEPRRTLFLVFFAGMLVVPLALFFENSVFLIEKKLGIEKTFLGMAALLFLWALIEEILKYLAAKYSALKKISFDEPIDALIYLITAALGFAALENIMFLLKTFKAENMMLGVITGNLRFVGATLLHVATSAIVGASIAFSFFRKENRKRNLFIGILSATVLHFVFNYFIMTSNGDSILKVFIPLWIFIIAVIFLFEKVKHIKSNR